MNEALLPNNFEALKTIIRDCEAYICDLKARNESQSNRIEFLEERLRLFQNELFRRSSEKRPVEEDPRQLHLFNEAETAVVEPAKEEITVPAYTRKKPKRKPLPDHLPRVEVIVDIAEEEKVCACGTALSRIGEEVSEKLDIIPAKVQVIRTIRPKYACKGCEGVESQGGAVKSQKFPLR